MVLIVVNAVLPRDAIIARRVTARFLPNLTPARPRAGVFLRETADRPFSALVWWFTSRAAFPFDLRPLPLNQRLVHLAPTPILAGLKRLDDRMLGRVEMLSRMSIWRRIAAADMSAGQA
jgi:hypothetical protein